MKRSLKLALIPTAIAAALTANQAFAGSEACFEVYQVGDDAVVTNHGVLYSAASCVAEATRGGATAVDLEATSSTSIAYELTGDLDVTLEDLNGDATADDELHIVYIPTTDLPSGTVITMQLSGATWDNNANQLHLVSYDAVGDEYSLVASSDGSFDTTDTVTFLTRAGVTIGAGTRLVMTTNNAIDGQNAAAGSANILSPNFNISNTACPTTGSVTLSAISAITDGGNGFNIAGGRSTSAQEIADISQQFVMFDDATDNGLTPVFTTGSATLVAELVDAEETGGQTPRTRFVNVDNTDFAVDLTSGTAGTVVYPFVMVDRAPLLDRAVTIAAADDVNVSIIASSDPGATVLAGLYDSWAGADAAPANPVDLDAATAATAIAPSIAGATPAVVALPGDAVFANNSNDAGSFYTENATVNDNAWVLSLENTTTDGVMNFNYTVDVQYSIDFDNTNLIDHCQLTANAFDIGVNGAVLKVPYAFEAAGNFVRITNEHSEEAVVTMDIFDESGNTQNSVAVGTIGAKSSVVYLTDNLVSLADADGYAGVGTRHTMTFTVTAPGDTVHGVSVQKIPGGVDRVMPVLDQNNWRQ